MKLYVIPVESACNGRCRYCITKYRAPESCLLDLDTLKQSLGQSKYDKIEITGGGEPSLHPQIGEIIKICSECAPTAIYTNGTLRPIKELKLLREIIISRAHHNAQRNQDIMGLAANPLKYKGLNVPVKLSLMLHRSGISTVIGLISYLQWASRNAYKVVIRQLFDFPDAAYRTYLRREFISTSSIAKYFPISDRVQKENSLIGFYGGLEIEFELRDCSCESTNPVLHANGETKEGWV